MWSVTLHQNDYYLMCPVHHQNGMEFLMIIVLQLLCASINFVGAAATVLLFFMLFTSLSCCYLFYFYCVCVHCQGNNSSHTHKTCTHENMKQNRIYTNILIQFSAVGTQESVRNAMSVCIWEMYTLCKYIICVCVYMYVFHKYAVDSVCSIWICVYFR